MKIRQTFFLSDEYVRKNALTVIKAQEMDGSVEVIIQDVSVNKTRKQLGAIYGLWVKFIADQGYSEKAVMAKWKAEFLARIYTINPVNPEQENWIDAVIAAQESGDQDKLKLVAKRISLSWANLDQVKEFMNAIEGHYIDAGSPLPVPDKHWKKWRKHAT